MALGTKFLGRTNAHVQAHSDMFDLYGPAPPGARYGAAGLPRDACRPRGGGAACVGAGTAPQLTIIGSNVRGWNTDSE